MCVVRMVGQAAAGGLGAEHLQAALGGLELGAKVGVLLLKLGDVLVPLGDRLTTGRLGGARRGV